MKTEQLKEVLGWWGNLTDYDNYSWDSYTNRQMVVKSIWRRATRGNRQDLDILLSLGLLDSEKYAKCNLRRLQDGFPSLRERIALRLVPPTED